MNHVDKRRGFTIIELMLAMTFISVLLLAIAMTIIQIGTIYNKGITLKEVNQTGRSVSDDLTRIVSSSGTFDLAANYIPNPSGGRLCAGQFSYIWNYAQALTNGSAGVVEYQTVNQPIRFIKIPDAAGAYCVRNGTDFTYANGDVLDADYDRAVELLRTGDRSLNIHQLSVTTNPAATDPVTGQQLYQVSFTIGTGDTAALNPTRTACSPPGTPGSDFAYCAVQQFTLVIRAGNGVN